MSTTIDRVRLDGYFFHKGIKYTWNNDLPAGVSMYNSQPLPPSTPVTPTPEPSSPASKTHLKAAFETVRDVLSLTCYTDLERSILEMSYVRGWLEQDICATLLLTPKEYRKIRSEAFQKALAGHQKQSRVTRVEVPE